MGIRNATVWTKGGAAAEYYSNSTAIALSARAQGRHSLPPFWYVGTTALSWFARTRRSKSRSGGQTREGVTVGNTGGGKGAVGKEQASWGGERSAAAARQSSAARAEARLAERCAVHVLGGSSDAQAREERAGVCAGHGAERQQWLERLGQVCAGLGARLGLGLQACAQDKRQTTDDKQQTTKDNILRITSCCLSRLTLNERKGRRGDSAGEQSRAIIRFGNIFTKESPSKRRGARGESARARACCMCTSKGGEGGQR